MKPTEPRKLRASLADEEVLACPECDSTAVNAPLIHSAERETTDDTRWRCVSCRARFEHPKIRDRYREDRNANGLAKVLLDLDPDAVGSEADR